MPQVIIEISPNVAADDMIILRTINQALDNSGVFRLQDIKTRLYRPKAFLMGDGRDDAAFIYVKVAIMKGRSDTIKEQLAKSVLSELKNVLGADYPTLSYGVEVVDLADNYQKA